MTTINKGDTVLVTGVSGYIGSHVAEELIAAGYKVRGTSRSSAKVQYLVDHLNQKFGPGKIEIVEVPDMIKDDAYDTAVVGVSGINNEHVYACVSQCVRALPGVLAGTDASTDQQTALLTQYQNQYEAASELLSSVKSMFSTLITMMGS